MKNIQVTDGTHQRLKNMKDVNAPTFEAVVVKLCSFWEHSMRKTESKPLKQRLL